ncbi:3-phosphoshikimate 1-carboxyvinyltransferase [Peribacillus kribbensis]|uniref:3-phosphoshikimate 1-carboxyvinyltransferase n=1 Tax=Peribacillus kribbensis TaxID=356658 RepID=UPI0003F539E9|nr:3-phosphoshikimate 1-carboxyvinyltransferase [Peribacillus kribbensis]
MESITLSLSGASLQGEVEIPGDKSISHRAVMFGSLAEGVTTVRNFLPGSDCLSTIDCFRKLGVRIHQEGSNVTITGNGFRGLLEPQELLDTGNSGTTTRLMLGILAGLPFHSVMAGDSSIAKRPMGRVVSPLREMGAVITGRSGGEYTPLAINGSKLKGIRYELPVASAQVKSAILLAGLQAEGETVVIEKSKTRDHTERMIVQFGGAIDVDQTVIKLNGPQVLKAADVHVPGDISSAAFFLAAGAVTPHSTIVLRNVGLNPTRDGILEVLKRMGAKMTISRTESEAAEPVGDITISSSELQGVEISGNLIPRLIDEIPIIALIATQARGKTIIRDAAELKVKETNRIDTVAGELAKLGAKITPTEDGLIIEGKTSLSGAEVSSHGDHRIGMMLSVASLITEGELVLQDPASINVSYPQFFEHLNSLAGSNK